ncbi:phenol 2-monooxygenase P2 subunit [Solimonas aquatica]|uniref:Phenol 2-monooxygenase P2 subunit n=1 Tax=Solimonas aquatica TaxID=489703 RepID=A0A1H9BJB7_9GAMM|nr:MmoB/DmpM family protein [Solimonas aquatica]SEP88368.1 phenol 2-monooxygenase P2 subunit [Solimonas aquatica]
MSTVFIAFQKTEDARGVIDAILQDNPAAIVNEQPAMVRIESPEAITIKRATVEDLIGRRYDLQEMQIHLITLSGHVDESDDEFKVSWTR